MLKKILLSLCLLTIPTSLLALNFPQFETKTKNSEPSNQFTKVTSGLPEKYHIYSIMQDKEGNIWAGGDEGLYEQKATTYTFIHVTSGLSNHIIISSIMEDCWNNIWVGGDNGDDQGLYELKDGETTFVTYNSGLPSGFQTAFMMQDSAKNIWVCGAPNFHGERLYRLKERTEQFIEFTNGLPNNWGPLCMMQDSEGNIWIGNGLIGGYALYVIRAKTDTLVQFTNGITYGFSAYTMMQDSEGNIWIGGVNENDHSGLYKLKKDNDTFINFSNGLTSNVQYSSMMEDNAGNIWIGSRNDAFYNSLYELKKGTNTFLPVRSGLPNNMIIYSMIQDNLDNLWVTDRYEDGGLYESKTGNGYSFFENDQHTEYTDEANNWIISNKTITFWARERDIDDVTINGADYNQGNFNLDGNDYAAKNGQYKIKINFTKESGKTSINFAFWVKQDIHNDFAFNSPSGDNLQQYTGYLNGEESRKVNVLYVYDPAGASQAILNMQLGNELIIDWDNTYFQKLDANFLPTGDKDKFANHTEQTFKDNGLYLLTISDKVGNSLTYYIQIGGNDPLVSKFITTPWVPIGPSNKPWVPIGPSNKPWVPIGPSNPIPTPSNNLAAWEIALIAIGSAGFIFIALFSYTLINKKLKVSRNNLNSKIKSKKNKNKKL